MSREKAALRCNLEVTCVWNAFSVRILRQQPSRPEMVLTQGEMGNDTSKDEGCQEGERQDEGVEEPVVALPDTVAHPGAVVIKPL